MWINDFVSSRRWIVLWVPVLAFPGLGFAAPQGQSNGRTSLRAARRMLHPSFSVPIPWHQEGYFSALFSI